MHLKYKVDCYGFYKGSLVEYQYDSCVPYISKGDTGPGLQERETTWFIICRRQVTTNLASINLHVYT